MMMQTKPNREQLSASYDWYRQMRETQPVFFDQNSSVYQKSGENASAFLGIWLEIERACQFTDSETVPIGNCPTSVSVILRPFPIDLTRDWADCRTWD